MGIRDRSDSEIKPPIPEYKGSWYQYTIPNRITEITGTLRDSREELFAFLKSSLHRLKPDRRPSLSASPEPFHT